MWTTEINYWISDPLRTPEFIPAFFSFFFFFGGVRVDHLLSLRSCVGFCFCFVLFWLFILFYFIFCCFFAFVLCLVYPMLPVSLDCPFLFVSSVFSNVYLKKYYFIWVQKRNMEDRSEYPNLFVILKLQREKNTKSRVINSIFFFLLLIPKTEYASIFCIVYLIKTQIYHSFNL